MKTEQLKIIAEAQNIKVVGGLDIPVTEFKEFYYAEKLYYYDGRWIEWNPETNAEQTLMVLEWLEELDVRIEMQRFPGIWYIEIWNKETENIKQINNSDFQTAVCMAAFEYAETLKK